ncbi:PH domain-containing protein [Halovulum dunhuangense]|uniref:PH domain-containing protein n=1 Tax=Halovulum dunhuangense TaxID=1505036 RepID=A0A849KZ90_9RHOB|nr:photosynthetic complex putative assembly protein PuhB [Halovulum dunhuangense]NNU79372.1 PH domain-containing protein [Halovulum dunhuangense]
MAHDDFATEPHRGLDRHLPEGETILWQGQPRAWDLACAAMSLRWVIGYFLLLAAWRGIALGGTEGLEAGLRAVSWYLVAGALTCGIILLGAWVFARTTVYTITSSRVVMRIGAALTVSLNLPYKWIARADLALAKNGSGSIHLDLKGETRFSYLVLWPHVRPWQMRRPQPTLRAIPDARKVAAILGAAAEARVGEITSDLGTDDAAMPAPAGAVAAE